jgi:hypothetical protein
MNRAESLTLDTVDKADITGRKMYSRNSLKLGPGDIETKESMTWAADAWVAASHDWWAVDPQGSGVAWTEA